MNFEPRVDEWPDEPAPDGPLMISRIACPQIAVIGRFVIGMPRRKRTQAERCEQLALHHIQHGSPAFWGERRMIERDREDLVRPAGRIVGVLQLSTKS